MLTAKKRGVHSLKCMTQGTFGREIESQLLISFSKTIEIVLPFINLGVWSTSRNQPKKLGLVS